MTCTEHPLAVITFDDGPEPEVTPRILELISRYNIRAAFCVLGDLVSKHPDIVKDAADLGCEIVNHSWNHENFTKLTDDEISKNISKAEDAIFGACRIHTGFVRPPYGCSNDRIANVIKNLNKAQLFWNGDSLDWKDRDASIISARVMNEVRDGHAILLHDIYLSSFEAAAIIIPELLNRGYELITASELLSRKNVQIIPGEKYLYDV